MTPNLKTTILETNATWTATARPIIKAMFAVEDAIHPVTTARLADPKGYRRYSEMSPAARDWEEAQCIVEKAGEALHNLLDGIRDNALCDAYINVDYDAADDVIDAQEAFNEDLARSVISVEGLVKQIGNEA